MLQKNRLMRRAALECLDQRRLMAVDILETEPNNSESQATRFDWDGEAEVRLLGTSQNKDDKDYFVFTAPTTGPVHVAVTSAAGAKLEVNTRAGSQVFENDPKDGLNAGSWQATAGQSYLLRLRAPDKAAAEYAVLLSAGQGGGGGGGSGGGSSSSSGAEVEPNNRPGLATQVALTSAAPITLSGSASKRDRDFFFVQPDSAGKVQLDTGNSGIKVSVETASGAKLFESEPRDGITSGSFDVAVGQGFYVRARGTSGDVTQYSLALTLSASGAPTGGTGNSTGSSAAAVRDAWLDASDDGSVSPIDALLVINYINSRDQSHSADDALLGLDTNDDRTISALDVLLVVNRINQHGSGDINDSFDDSDIRKRRGQ